MNARGTLPNTQLSATTATPAISAQMPAIGARLPLRLSLVFAALRELILYDLLASLSFKRVRATVAGTNCRRVTAEPEVVIQVVDAVRVMCVLYFKKSHCLQRAFVATRLLRRCGIDASLIIGSQPAPIRSHAWVEVESVPVINRISHLEFYQVIDSW